MTTLNARANQAWHEWLEGPGEGLEAQGAYAFEEGWETGYKTAESEAAERAESFRGVHEKAARAELAEEILAALESLTPLWLANTPTTDDGLGRREVLRLVREIGGLS